MMVTDANCEYLCLSRLCLMEAAGKSLGEEVAKIAVFTFAKPVKVVMFTGSGGNKKISELSLGNRKKVSIMVICS